MNAERRKKKRRKPEDMTFVAMRPEFTRLGRILDINKEGLCFQYMAKEAQRGNAASADIDIFTGGSEYYMAGVPCRLIYDAEIRKKMAYFTDVEYRRCGLQFLKLTKEQSDLLEFYLKNHTSDFLNH